MLGLIYEPLCIGALKLDPYFVCNLYFIKHIFNWYYFVEAQAPAREPAERLWLGALQQRSSAAASHNTESFLGRYKYSEHTVTRSHLAYKLDGDIAQHGEFPWQVQV